MRESYRHQPGRASRTLIIVSYVLAVVLPVIGIVLGVIVLNNGPRNHGIGIVALSIVVAIVSYVWLY